MRDNNSSIKRDKELVSDEYLPLNPQLLPSSKTPAQNSIIRSQLEQKTFQRQYFPKNLSS